MKALPILSPLQLSSLSPFSSFTISPSFPNLNHPRKALALLSRPGLILSYNSSHSRHHFKSPDSVESHLSDEDEEDDEDEDDEDDDDDEEAADEYEFGDEDDEDGIDAEGRGLSKSEEDEDEVPTTTSAWRQESRFQRVERIRAVVKELGREIIDVDELASVYDFRIDKFQRLAVEAFLRGSSVVVSAPTSSGKTLIAEAAAVATVARGRRIFYTTPLKALSNQKFRDFREMFGEANVGLLTGDSAVNKDAQILIMTTEVLRNMLYQSIGTVSSGSGLSFVDVIVLDEVHYLSDISRGTVWEEIVIYCPKEVQLMCLSATVKNPDELAGWIREVHGETELVTTERRPVPLTWHFSTKTNLLPLLEEKGKRMNRRLSLNYLQLSAPGSKSYGDEEWPRRKNSKKRSNRGGHNSKLTVPEESLSRNDISRIRRSLVPRVVDTLAQLKARDVLPAVWFIFSRRGCDAAVKYVEDYNLLDECETSEVELALKKFSIQSPDAVREIAVRGLRRGVAAHHAGCLPLWKSFIEELFQRGLIKVVFATETLAAGINMPARTAVISSIRKRNASGRIDLRPNDLLQMAGRAGRRGIDARGHVVLIQSSTEGAEEACKLLSAGLEPLVSQFTASYGMVLNLLAGSKLTREKSKSGEDTEPLLAGRTLEEAKKLVEKSFGTYIGSNVMVASKEELSKIEKEIEILTSEISDDAIDRKSRKTLSEWAYKEIAVLQEQLREANRKRGELRRLKEVQKSIALKSLLSERESDHLPFVCLYYTDPDGVEHSVPAVYLGKADDSFSSSKLTDMVSSSADDSASPAESSGDEREEPSPDSKPSYHLALGSDNSWYLFTEKWIRTVYSTGFPNNPLSQGDASPRDAMWMLLVKEDKSWGKVAHHSEFGGLWCSEGSLETWSWSLNVPVLSSLSENDEILHTSQAYHDAVELYREQRNKVSRLKKSISRTEGFREYRKIMDRKYTTEDTIKRLKIRSARLAERIKEIEPSGWKEFLRLCNVVHEVRALDINTQVIFPLGETAAAIRGDNELWLAMVLRSRLLLDLKPSELAGVCASLVSEGVKVRVHENSNQIYEPSSVVVDVIEKLEKQRSRFVKLQQRHGVEISCFLDSKFGGMVEAWASGLSWKEMTMDCAMDDGDLARLLRRTIDLLAQIPKLPDVDPALKTNARSASDVMDRSPISELAG